MEAHVTADSLEECMRLARAMTLKNSAAGLAHGGGKSALWAIRVCLVRTRRD